MWAMASFFLRRLIFGLVALWAAVSLSFFYFASVSTRVRPTPRTRAS